MNHCPKSHWKQRLLLGAALFVASALSGLPAQAQVGPTAAEAAQYQGLHAAAWRGDAPKIEKLAATGANLNARDSHGSTPLHVATFARQRGAVRALMKAGAAFVTGDYTESLQALAALRAPVDAFFDDVMVNVDDPTIRANRLGLLAKLHLAMNQVADISKLST